MENLENLMIEYRIAKSRTSNVSSGQIKESKDELLALPYSGHNFKELLEKKFNFNDKELN